MWKFLLNLCMIGTPVKITIATKHYNHVLDWYELAVGYETSELHGSTILRLLPSPTYLYRRIRQIRNAKRVEPFSIGPALHPTEAQKRAAEWDRAAAKKKDDNWGL